MSVVNLLGYFMCLQYSALYLVESRAIPNPDEEGDDIEIQGSVGRLTDESYGKIQQYWRRWSEEYNEGRRNPTEVNGIQLDNLGQNRVGEGGILYQCDAGTAERRGNDAVAGLKRYTPLKVRALKLCGKMYDKMLAASAIPAAIIGGISNFGAARQTALLRECGL
jgi:hypothetical protein